VDIIGELKSFGINVQMHDPMALPEEAVRQYGIDLIAADALRPADAVILAVAHETFVRSGWALITALLKSGVGVVLDVKGRLNRAERPAGIELWRL